MKLTGDGALVEFPSVVGAALCAVDIQRSIAERNAKAAEEKRIKFRVGINLGDVIIDGSDIYGDGVNVAAGGTAIFCGIRSVLWSSGFGARRAPTVAARPSRR
jgi:hypothetical protein